MSTYIDSLKWRYATKKFDSTKKVSEKDIETLKEALQLTASSFGIQAYKFVIVENEELKKQLRNVSWNQQQVEQASHLFILCSRTETDNSDIDAFIDNICKTRGVEPETIKEYADFMKNTISGMPQEHNSVWTAKQVYIAAGNFLSACAVLQIDSCPMEGFDAAKYDEILGLQELGLTSSMVIPVGYRAEDDVHQQYPKVRKSFDDLFITL